MAAGDLLMGGRQFLIKVQLGCFLLLNLGGQRGSGLVGVG